MATGVNRRSFLKGSASASLMLCMGQLSWAAGAGRTAFTDLLAGENIVYDLSLIHISEPTRPY